MLFESPLFELSYQEKQHLLLPRWSGKELDAESFMDTMLQYKEVMLKTKANKVVWDHTHFRFAIPDALYPWIEQEINLPAKEHGMNRIGFILGEDVMAQFTTMESFESTRSIYEPHYFADPKKAIDWIVNKKTILSNPFEKELQIIIDKKADAGIAKIQIDVDLEQLPYYLKRLKDIFHEQSFAHQNYQKFNRLSAREREVLHYIIDGFSTKGIASRLFTSHHTVSTHRKNIMNKLECRTIGDLIKFKVLLSL